MGTRRRLIVRHRSTRLTLVVAFVASFCFGLILFIGLETSYPAILMPLTQSRQTRAPQSLSVMQAKSKVALKPGLSRGQQSKTSNLLVNIPVQFQGTTFADVKLTGQDKAIALTFDDGPWPKSTEQILGILQQHNIKSTFFWIGQNVKNYPQLAQKVVADGQTVGNHTWHHWYRHMDRAAAASEIERTAAVIFETTGVRTSIFRPPGGILSNGPADYAKTHQYGVVMWSADSEDYNRPSVPRLVKNVLSRAKSGGIVLMHDGGGDRSHTVEALPLIIAALTKSGYRFVTVPELLEIKDKERVVSRETKSALNTATLVSHPATAELRLKHFRDKNNQGAQAESI
ncbi:MAG: polysaccharide deacetylase family protein [Chroococcidiopsidaceae cyanobacterium CP_BM_RX_35]|nr:polysaccharide deacetylase family protein [Chroococcidiopsidaceae cyanobacterium CP_BM_RX_35]